MMDMDYFRQNLWYLREQAGITREELAKKAGLSSETISSYEKGRRKPSLQSASNIADALGCSLSAFVRSVQ